MNWYSVTTDDEQTRLAAAWPGAPIENEELCSSLLEVARGQVLSYAPDPEDSAARVTLLLGELGYTDSTTADVLALLAVIPETPPVNYVYAQLQQAKNLWAAGRADENGDIGTEGFSFVPRPLDKTIKNIIRPVEGKPRVL